MGGVSVSLQRDKFGCQRSKFCNKGTMSTPSSRSESINVEYLYFKLDEVVTLGKMNWEPIVGEFVILESLMIELKGGRSSMSLYNFCHCQNCSIVLPISSTHLAAYLPTVKLLPW